MNCRAFTEKDNFMSLVYKIKSKNYKKIFFLVFLFIFSILFNQHYANLGIYPIDSFTIFNSGYDVLNGHYPFRDYWTVTGPMLDIIQALFFKIFGISWNSYVIHASFFNFIIAISTFYVLHEFKLNINYCFFYALLVSILAYPTAGTPFVDHHSTILSMVSIFSFILALKTKNNIYWFSLPIILGMAFLSKQVPAAYITLIIIFLTIINFSFNFNIKNLISTISGALVFLIFIIFLMIINKVSPTTFVEQYILHPLSIGNSRIELLFPLEFKRVILRFKLIHLSLLLLIVLCYRKILEDYKYIIKNEFLIIISLIISSFALIAYQLMTINAKFIFFIIPILIGFSHIYYNKYFIRKKYILYLLVTLSISSTFWYQLSYNETRKFMDLGKVDIKNAVDAKILNENFNELKWITRVHPKEPGKEIFKLKKAIKILEDDQDKKIIVTDYQFISVFLSSYDYSPSKFWHRGVSYPQKGDKYFKNFRDLFIKILKDNKIKSVYVVKPLYLDDQNGDVLTPILDNECTKKSTLTDILDKYLILDCNDLN